MLLFFLFSLSFFPSDSVNGHYAVLKHLTVVDMLSQSVTFITGLIIKSDNTLSPHFNFKMVLQ